MCGIAGIYRPDGVVHRYELEAMARALHHRGPDAWGIWHEGDIGLAHTRLKIVDLSERAAQPMVSASGHLRLVYNGEIYNHHALRRSLQARGVPFRSTSDTEVLLEGYAHDAESYLTHLQGMFAFALWDASKQRLLLGRDRAGEKPLFYIPLDKGGVAFASEIKALRAVESLGIQKNLEQIPKFLLYGYIPPPATFYKNAFHLEPAHIIAFSRGNQATPKRYWSPCFQPAPNPPSYEDAKYELRTRMRTIVRDRLEADVPVGAFLSGGLDSATIVGVATRDLQKTVHSFSIGFEDTAIDESKDARLSANHLGSIHEEFMVTERDIPSVESLVHYHDGPFADSSAIPTYLVSKMARSRVTVAVTGDGGDEVFGGYPRFVGGALAERIPRWVGQFAGNYAHYVKLMLRHSGFPDRIDQLTRLGQSIERPLEHRFLHWNSIFPLDTVNQLRVSNGSSTHESITNYNDSIFAESRGQVPLARILYHNFRTYLPEDLLVKVDRTSMAVALETRSPLLDSSLIDFVGSLPDHYKIQGLKTKRILRDTFEDLFVPELLKRPKRGFAVPLTRWLDGPLKAELESAIRGDNARIYEHINRSAVERLLWSDAASQNRARTIQAWALWTLEVWLRSP